jgi:hypothetical protein
VETAKGATEVPLVPEKNAGLGERAQRGQGQEHAHKNNAPGRVLRDGQSQLPAPERVPLAGQRQDDGHGTASKKFERPGETRLAMTAPPRVEPLLKPAVSVTPIQYADRMPAVVPPSAAERPAVPPATMPAPAPSTPPPVAPTPSHNPAARHLKEVVHALRVEHAPRSALDLLDRHASELAGNAFAEEALLLRVEAMLALRQQPEALRLLDGMSLSQVASSSVLLVTRGQLRANANRCTEAVADFDLVLTRALRPSKQALQGRAQCKQKLGDALGAKADLERLNREFPEAGQSTR